MLREEVSAPLGGLASPPLVNALEINLVLGDIVEGVTATN